MRFDDYMSRTHYDAVVVGGGAAGSLIAKRLGDQGWRVLVLEAGTGEVSTWHGHETALDTYYTTINKTENSPYLFNPAAPSPSENLATPSPETANRAEEAPIDYYVQKGELPYASSYLRSLGGSMLHWQGATPRMVPEDFHTCSKFDRGRDWPLDLTDPKKYYDNLEKYYEWAEYEIGVAGDAAEQRDLGTITNKQYEYPMHKIPLSHMDHVLGNKLNGASAKLSTSKDDRATAPAGELRLRSVPQGRNSEPNLTYRADYHPRTGYRPAEAVGLPNYGERCNGNSNCIPICPVQAKYTPLKTQAKFNKDLVTVVTRAVVTRVLFGANSHPGEQREPRPGDGARQDQQVVQYNQRAVGVEYKMYDDPRSAAAVTHAVTGDVIILAAHAVENAKLLLASGARNCNDNGNGPIGRHLMDHPVLVTWALMPPQHNMGAYRGPMSSSSIDGFRRGGPIPGNNKNCRSGNWRELHAPFRIEPDNWGWSLPLKSPGTDVQGLIQRGRTHWDPPDVFRGPVLGTALRDILAYSLPRQIQLSFSMEQPAEWTNRVTLDDRYRDNLGNHRPVIYYNLSEYVREGFVRAREVSHQIFERLGTHSLLEIPTPHGIPFDHNGQRFYYWGGSHAAGTHIMGHNPDKSVVDQWQRCYYHPNLFVVGSGSMPTMGTSNPSLTLAALALRTAEVIHDDLVRLRRPITVSGCPAVGEQGVKS